MAGQETYIAFPCPIVKSPGILPGKPCVVCPIAGTGGASGFIVK